MDLTQALNILGLEKAPTRSHIAFFYKMPKRPLDPEFARQTIGQLHSFLRMLEDENSRKIPDYRQLIEAWEAVMVAIETKKSNPLFDV